ncbi:MAG TPA: PQQ-binding-like beta-propeller repeat protein [Gemmataceae bacterium]|jgi:outer membrane protein assembly factor BamB|nr:PQQ-binding-like beta-propeller repeat protein [Gemmataceae bacterium]
MTARGFLLLSTLGLVAAPAAAGDWPQWRGPNRDAKADFTAPKAWPKELTQKWKVAVGDGVATPALVGDKLYVFSRQDGNEVLRCLAAADGKELWAEKYASPGAEGPARGFSGPRSSPAVADGKIVTLGVRGMLVCRDAGTGKELWKKDEFTKSMPKFQVASSPLIADGLVVAQLGGESNGAIVAYDLATGTEKWKWDKDGTAYASPTLITVDGTKAVVAETAKKVVAIGLTDGKLLWETPFAVKGRGYNAVSPAVRDLTLVYSGDSRGTTAVTVGKKGDELAATQLWTNPEASSKYNSLVVKGDLVFGLSEMDKLFCLDAKTGKTAWSTAIPGKRGYGNIVDLGPALMVLTPSAELTVFEPTDKEYKELAKYKVGTDTYAYPVVAGNRVFVKDKDAVTLWVVE